MSIAVSIAVDHHRFTAEAMPHFAELSRAARRFARGPSADDLVQETFLRAWKSRHRYRAGSNARAWLYQILANTAHTAHRRDLRDRRMRERFAVEPVAPPEPAVAPRPALAGKLCVALDALPENFRRVVELTDVDGLSYRETAARLAVPIGTVMSRLHRARRRLRRDLAQAGQTAVPHERQNGSAA